LLKIIKVGSSGVVGSKLVQAAQKSAIFRQKNLLQILDKFKQAAANFTFVLNFFSKWKYLASNIGFLSDTRKRFFYNLMSIFRQPKI